MIKNLYSRISFCLFYLFLGNILFSQSLTVPADGVPTNVIACGDAATFKINVFGPLASGTKITAQLPAEAKYQSLTSGNVTVDASNPNKPVFTTTTALASGSDFISVVYTVTTGCAAMTAPKITYSTTAPALSTTVNYATVNYPFVEVTNVSPVSASLGVFQSQVFTVTVKETSATPSKNAIVRITHSTNVELSAPNMGTLTLGTPSGTLQTDLVEITNFSGIGNNNTLFDQNETLDLKITAKLKGCPSGAGETLSFQAAYGCNGFSACTTGNITNAGISLASQGTPALEIVATTQAHPGLKGQKDYSVVNIKNKGTGAIYNLTFQFADTGYVNPNVRWIFDDYSVNNVPIANDPNSNTAFQFTFDPDGPGVGLADLDGDGFFDDLPAGQSFNLKSRWGLDLSKFQWTDCLSPAGSGNLDEFEMIRFKATYTNSCGAATNYQSNSTYFTEGQWRPLSFYNKLQSFVVNNTTAPANGSNFVAGDKFTVQHIVSYDGYNPFSFTRGNVGASGAFWRATLKVPPSVVNDGNGSGGGNTFIWIYNAALSSPATGILVYDADFTDPDSYKVSGINSFPLKVLSPCLGNYYGVIDSKISLYESANVKVVDMFCGSTPNITIACGNTQGIRIDNFKFDRDTYGQALINNYTGGAQLNANSPGVLPYRFLMGDMAICEIQTTVMNPFTDAKWIFEYDADLFLQLLNDGELKEVSGTYTKGAVTTPFTIPASAFANYYTYVENDGASSPKSRHTFDLMKLFQAGGPLSAFNPSVNDKLTVSLRFKVTEYYDGQVNGNNITNVTFINSTVANTPQMSNAKTDVINIIQRKKLNFPSMYALNTSEFLTININGCNEYEQRVQFGYAEQGSQFSTGNPFPSEYRNIENYKVVEVLIPAGLTYVPSSSNTIDYNVQNVLDPIADPVITYGFNAQGVPTANGTFNKLTWTNNGDWKKYRFASWAIQYLSFRLRPNSNVTNWSFGSNRAGFVVLPTSNRETYLNTTTPYILFSDRRPHSPITNFNGISYAVNSGTINVTTPNKNAQWDLNVQNTNLNYDMINTWIAIENPSNNINFTLWDGATQIPLVSYGTGKVWGKVGTILKNSTKTFTIKTNSYTVCSSQSFLAKVGQDCIEYPTSPDAGYPSQNGRTGPTKDITFSLNVQHPNIQASTPVTPPFNICDSVTQTLDLLNTANGYAYNFKAEVVMPTGMTMVNTSAKVIYNGVTYNIPASGISYNSTTNTYTVTISSANSPLNTNGLPNAAAPEPNSFKLQYNFVTNCDFLSGSRIHYNVNYESSCGLAAQIVQGQNSIDSAPLKLAGSPAGKSFNTTFVGEESNGNAILQSYGEELFTVTTINQGSVVSDLNDKIVATFDKELDIVPNSTTNGLVLTSNTIVGSKRRLIWNMPINTAIGGTINFSFKLKVIAPEKYSCDENTPMDITTYYIQDVACGAVTCNVFFPTGNEANSRKIIRIAKPSANVVYSFTTSSNPNSSTLALTYNYTLSNTTVGTFSAVSPVQIPAGTLLVALDDANGNGNYDVGETIYPSPVPTTADVTQGNSVTGSVTFNVPKNKLTTTIFGLLMDRTPYNPAYFCNVVFQKLDVCYKPATSGIGLESKHGITSLGRAGTDNGNWPMVRQGAYTVLEAKSKGFVMNRLTTSEINSLVPVLGMAVYDTSVNCLKIFDGTSWKCYSQPTCQ